MPITIYTTIYRWWGLFSVEGNEIVEKAIKDSYSTEKIKEIYRKKQGDTPF